MINPSKIKALEEELAEVGIHEDDLIEKFILGSGPGGQKINKTNSCVYLKHIPTGFEIKCQKGRSREINRYYARKELIEKIKDQILHIQTKKKAAIAKLKKQKKRRSRKSQEKTLQAKRERSEVKSNRQPPQKDE